MQGDTNKVDGTAKNTTGTTATNRTTTGTTNTDGYTATRTTTGTRTTFMGMTSTAWTWLIIGIAAIAIVALVWYYGNQVNHSRNDR